MSLEIISPTTGEKLQVAPQDLGRMSWEPAKEACAYLGSGWRLPTPDELQVMYKELHLKGKGNFCGDCLYWSTQKGASSAWAVNFASGVADDYHKRGSNYPQVRAVRAL
jgi:hypothetical protein